MKFLNVLALRGPNLWAWSPVIEAWVDLGEWKDRPSTSIPGFNERLMLWLPSMIEHRCSIGERGGFFERLRTGTYMAHILEHVALELQSLAGVPLGFGRARETSKEGVYKVVFKYKDEGLARACLDSARELVLAAAEDRPFALEQTLERLRNLAARNLPSPGVEAILCAAKHRNVPCIQLDLHGTLQLGQGSKARRFRAGQSDRTGAIAQSIAEDIELTRRLVANVGLPAPESCLVSTKEEAWEAAEDIEPPVNVRPQWTTSAPRGVSLNLTSREQVEAAFDTAKTESSAVIVEQYIPGSVIDLLVVNGTVIAATRESASGRIDVLPEVHPGVAEAAVSAARTVGLDLAAVQIAATAISEPLPQSGAAILDVISPPPLEIFFSPPEDDEPQPVALAILDWLFPNGETGRIPIVAITGTNGKTTVTRFIAHLLGDTFGRAGMATTDGIYWQGRRIVTGDCSGPTSARNVLMNPGVDVAVLETARGGMLRAGLAFDECSAAVVTNVAGGDHLGLSDIQTSEQLARVKRMIVESLAEEGAAVLNADDPLVAGMAEKSTGGVLYFSRQPANPVVESHRESGGRAVFVRDGTIVFADGRHERALLPAASVPLTLGGKIAFQVENTLAAIAAAWSLGVSLETLEARAKTFSAGLDSDPARFNVLEHRGATVIVDFGHNVDSLRAVIPALDAFQGKRRAALFSSSGDRRDQDIVEMGALLGDAFDRVILYEDADRYERKPGEIIALLRQGLARGKRVAKIEEIEGGLNAFQHAWNTVEPGELLLAQAHSADQTVEFLRRRAAAP